MKKIYDPFLFDVGGWRSDQSSVPDNGAGVLSFWDTYASMVAGVSVPATDGLYGVRTTTGVWPLRKKKGIWRYTGSVYEWFSELSSEFLDTEFTIHGSTGELQFDASALTALRTFSLPDASGALVLEADIVEVKTFNLSQQSTGLYSGGNLSINSGDNTKYDLAAGVAYFIDSFTDSANPITLKITWETQTGLTLTNMTDNPVTFLSINSSGTLVESNTAPIEGDRRDLVMLGGFTHETLTFLRKVLTAPWWMQDTSLREFDFYEAIGFAVNKEGNEYSENGANLKIDKSVGTTFGAGYNYANDLKNPNITTDVLETAIIFPLFYRDTPTNQVSLTDTIPTTQYDPNGDGTLIDIPSGFFTTHRIYFDPTSVTTVIQYGQYVYDSLKKASDAFDKEDFDQIQEVANINCRCVLIIQEGATDLSDPLQAKFANLGTFGDKGFSIIPSYARFVESAELIDAMSYQTQDITLTLDTGVIYVDIEAEGGGDIIYAFSQREYTLDCTTGSGPSGVARIALVAGTATNPQENYVSVIRSGDVVVLQAGTSRPTGEFAYVGKFLLPDITTFGTDGAYSTQRYNDAKEISGRGSVQRTNERIRILDAEYESGIAQTITITPNVGVPDDVDFDSTSGKAWQKHLQSFPAFDVSTDGIYVVNHPTTPYLKITDLADVLVDANNNSLSGLRFNLVIWGAISKSTNECKLFLNLPLGSYGSDAAVISDANQSSVTSIPKEFRGTGFLIARVPLRHQVISGGTWTNIALSELGTQVIDLRGQRPGNYGGGVSIPASSTFSDANFQIFNETDNSKLTEFDISNIATATTRKIVMPNVDIYLADILLNNIYRGVGHLPLAGGTLTGKLTVPSITKGVGGTYEAGAFGYSDANWGYIFRPPAAGGQASHKFEAFDGTQILQMQENGDIGIGTAPDHKLSLMKCGQTGGMNIGPDTTLNNWRLKFYHDNYSGLIDLKNNANALNVRITSDGDSYFNGGYLGIGTSSPGRHLELYQNTFSPSYLRYGNAGPSTYWETYAINRNAGADKENAYYRIAYSDTGVLLTIDGYGSLSLGAGTGVNEFSIDGTLAGDSDDAVPTEKAVKTFSDPTAIAYFSSSTIVGWSSVSGTIYYRKIGKQVTVWFSIDGTSNSTAINFTLPYSNNSNIGVYGALGYAKNNSSTILTACNYSIVPNSNLVQCYINMGSGSWVASGDKTVQGHFIYYTD